MMLFLCTSFVLSAMAELNIEPYDEDEGTGELRYVQVMYFMDIYSSYSCFRFIKFV